MNFHHKFLPYHIISSIILLTACVSQVPILITTSPKPTQTIIATSSSTQNPIDAPVNIPSNTPSLLAPPQIVSSTSTPFVTSASPVLNKLPNLSEVVLKIDDVKDEIFAITFTTAFQDGILSVEHRTDELQNQCLYDCVKVIWGAPFPTKIPTSSRKLTIIMFVTSSVEKSKQAIESLDQDYNNLDSIEHDDYTSMLTDPSFFPEGSKAFWNQDFVLITYRDEVVLLIISQLNGVRDVDNTGEIVLLKDFAGAQIEKLKGAGFPP